MSGKVFTNELELLLAIQELAPSFGIGDDEPPFDAFLSAFSYLKRHAIIDETIESNVFRKLLRLEGKSADVVSEVLLSLSSKPKPSESPEMLRTTIGGASTGLNIMQKSERRSTEDWHRSARMSHLSRKIQGQATRMSNSTLGHASSIAEMLNGQPHQQSSPSLPLTGSGSGSGSGRAFSDFEDLIASPATAMATPTTRTDISSLRPISPPSRAKELLQSLRRPTSSDVMSSRLVSTLPNESVPSPVVVTATTSAAMSATTLEAEMASGATHRTTRSAPVRMGSHLSQTARSDLMRTLLDDTPVTAPSIHYSASSSDLATHVRIFLHFQHWLSGAMSELKGSLSSSSSSSSSSAFSMVHTIFGLYGRVASLSPDESMQASVTESHVEMVWLVDRLRYVLAKKVQAITFARWHSAHTFAKGDVRAREHHAHRSMRRAFETMLMNRHVQGESRRDVSSSGTDVDIGAEVRRSGSSPKNASKSQQSVHFDDDYEDFDAEDSWRSQPVRRAVTAAAAAKAAAAGMEREITRAAIDDEDDNDDVDELLSGGDKSLHVRLPSSLADISGASSSSGRLGRERTPHPTLSTGRERSPFDWDEYYGRSGQEPGQNQDQDKDQEEEEEEDDDDDDRNDDGLRGYLGSGRHSRSHARDPSSLAPSSGQRSHERQRHQFASKVFSRGASRAGHGDSSLRGGGSRSVYRLSLSTTVDDGDFGHVPNMSFVDLTREKMLFRKMTYRLLKVPRQRRARKELHARLVDEAVDLMDTLRLQHGFARVRRFPSEERLRAKAREEKWADIWNKPGVLKTIGYIRCPAYVRCFKRLVDFFHDAVPSSGAFGAAEAQERRWMLKCGHQRWKRWLHRRRRGRISHSRGSNEVLIDCVGRRLGWTVAQRSEFGRNFFRAEWHPDTKDAMYMKQVKLLAQFVTKKDWERARHRSGALRFLRRVRDLRAVPVLYFNRFDFEISPGGGHYLPGGVGHEIATNPGLAAQLGESASMRRNRASGGCRLAPHRVTFSDRLSASAVLPGVSVSAQHLAQDARVSALSARGPDWKNPASFLFVFHRPLWKMGILDQPSAAGLPRSPIETMRRRQQAVRMARAMTLERGRGDRRSDSDAEQAMVWRGNGVAALYGNASFGSSPLKGMGATINFEPLRHTLSGPACRLALRRWRIQAHILKRLRTTSERLCARIETYRQRSVLHVWHELQVHRAEARNVRRRHALRQWAHRAAIVVHQRRCRTAACLFRKRSGLYKMFAFLQRVKGFRAQLDAAISVAIRHMWEHSASKIAHGEKAGASNRRIDRLLREQGAMSIRDRHKQEHDAAAAAAAAATAEQARKNTRLRKRKSAVLTRMTLDDNHVTGSSYVTLSRCFRHLYDRSQTTMDMADSMLSGTRHHRHWHMRQGLRGIQRHTDVQLKAFRVGLLVQRRYIFGFKSVALAKKTERLFIYRHFMCVRNKFLSNKYMRCWMRPLMARLRWGFDKLRDSVRDVEQLGERLVVQNGEFWTSRMFTAWQESTERRQCARHFWKIRFLRKLRWLVTRRRWVENAWPFKKARQFPQRYALNVFGYRTARARRLRVIAEKHCHMRTASRAFAAFLVMAAERRMYYAHVHTQLGHQGKVRLCNLTHHASHRHRNIVTRLISQTRRYEESRMRQAMGRLVYKDPTAVPGSAVSYTDISGMDEVLSQVAKFEDFVVMNMKKGMLATMFEHDEDLLQPSSDNQRSRPSRDEQVKKVLKSLRRKSIAPPPSSTARRPGLSAASIGAGGGADHAAAAPPTAGELARARRRASLLLPGQTPPPQPRRSELRRMSAFRELHEVQEETDRQLPTQGHVSTAEIQRTLTALFHTQREVSNKRPAFDPPSSLTRVMYGAQLLEMARNRKVSSALQHWHQHVDGLKALRDDADILAKRQRTRRTFRQLRIGVRIGIRRKHMAVRRALTRLRHFCRRVDAQREFVFTSTAYHEAATALRALRVWHLRARRLSGMHERAHAHRHHRRDRAIQLAMHKWRIASFATGFAVQFQQSRLDEDQRDDPANYRATLLFKDLQ